MAARGDRPVARVKKAAGFLKGGGSADPGDITPPPLDTHEADDRPSAHSADSNTAMTETADAAETVDIASQGPADPPPGTEKSTAVPPPAYDPAPPAPAPTTTAPAATVSRRPVRPATPKGEPKPRHNAAPWDTAETVSPAPVPQVSLARLALGPTVMEEYLVLPDKVHHKVVRLSDSSRIDETGQRLPRVSQATIRAYALSYALSQYSAGERSWAELAPKDGRLTDGMPVSGTGKRRQIPLTARMAEYLLLVTDAVKAQHADLGPSRTALLAMAIDYGLTHAGEWIDAARQDPVQHFYGYPSRQPRTHRDIA